jgi:hypothetical protein
MKIALIVLIVFIMAVPVSAAPNYGSPHILSFTPHWVMVEWNNVPPGGNYYNCALDITNYDTSEHSMVYLDQFASAEWHDNELDLVLENYGVNYSGERIWVQPSSFCDVHFQAGGVWRYYFTHPYPIFMDLRNKTYVPIALMQCSEPCPWY